MPVIFSKLVTRSTTPRTATNIPSVAQRIKRHYTVKQGLSGAKYGPPSYNRELSRFEKRVETGFSEMKSQLKWFGGLLFVVFGVDCVRCTSTQTRIIKRLDTMFTGVEERVDAQVTKIEERLNVWEAKLEKSLDNFERGLKGHIRTALDQFRLDVRNDRLQDELEGTRV